MATYAIKTAISQPDAESHVFVAQKTMYGGKHIAAGDLIYLFASENEGGTGLCARGVVISAEAIDRIPGIARQTPRISIAIRRTAMAREPFGRRELKGMALRNADSPEGEIHFKFYRQATNKIVGLSDEAAAFLEGFF